MDKLVWLKGKYAHNRVTIYRKLKNGRIYAVSFEINFYHKLIKEAKNNRN